MSNAEWIYAAVVLLVGMPAMLKNWTAVALVACYLFMQGSYYGFGLVFPVAVSVLADLTVILLILFKEPARDLWPYRDWRERARSFWLELSRWDRLVIGLFPVGWFFYAFADNAWWELYWLSLAQLLAASFEALETYRTARTAKRESAPDPPSSGFHFAPGRENRGYG